MVLYIVSFAIVIFTIAAILFMKWVNSPMESYIGYTQYKMPDLRISDDAPDWYTAKKTVIEWEANEPTRQQEVYYKHLRAMSELKKQMRLQQLREIESAKIRRWKEGRPVTKEDPL